MKNEKIKFRAWDKIVKVWYEQSNINGVLAFVNQESMKRRNWFDTELEIVQYTGLKDRNGEEIYEGDILQYKSEFVFGKIKKPIKENLDVRFQNGAFVTKLELLGNGLRNREMEIISNIYENPNLIN